MHVRVKELYKDTVFVMTSEKSNVHVLVSYRAVCSYWSFVFAVFVISRWKLAKVIIRYFI